MFGTRIGAWRLGFIGYWRVSSFTHIFVFRSTSTPWTHEAAHTYITCTLSCAVTSRVPADCRVVDSVELTVDESALTGENHPVAKTGEGIVMPGATPPLTQQRNMVFAGTLVNAGRGRALVVAVGMKTEFGKIAAELSTVESRKSPLQLKIDELGQKLATFSSLAIVVIGIWGYLMGRPFLETVTVAVSLAVAAIPEGLPICVTVTLALGVLRMTKRNVIVKKLPVVESLGCTTVVASDKTGTLTQNEMTARAIFSPAFLDTKFIFTGVGYDTKNGDLLVTHDVLGKEVSRKQTTSLRRYQRLLKRPVSVTMLHLLTTMDPMFLANRRNWLC